MNEKESKFYIEQYGDALAVKSNADNLTFNLNVHELLELQEKYTTLQCECMRFTDYVINLMHGRAAMAIHFDDEYLRMAGNMLFEAFRRLPKTDIEEIIKELKK